MSMFGNFEGNADEKLRSVRAFFAEFIDDAGCYLSDDRSEIIVCVQRFDGVWFEERLSTDFLPKEVVRHAVMSLGKRTRSPDVISDWERWASAWQVIKFHGERALDHAAQQIELLKGEGELGGVMVWQDVLRRIAVLQADPSAWAGRG